MTTEVEVNEVPEKKEEQPQPEPCLLDLTDDLYVGSVDPEVIDRFICILCYGIVFNPVKCNKCQTLICSRCINLEKMDEGKV